MLTHPLLSFNHISITDGSDDKRVLLDDVTGALHSGEQVVLMGASGSGKSLLLSALAGQLPLVHGQISLCTDAGVLEQASTSPPQWRDKVALVTQTPVMMDGTVLDNLQLPFSFGHHKSKQFDEHQQIAWLSQFGKSADFIHQDITRLSGGERQIVHFLRTLQLHPTVLLLDEPTAALDTVSAGVLMSLVQAWHNEKRAYLWISHRSDEVDALGAVPWQMTAGRLECAV